MKKIIKEWVTPFFIALAIAILLNIFVFQIMTVPTGSMIDTIMEGDRLYVNKIFNVDNVKRGDILVFKSQELKIKLVKRLIGLPGETVEIKSNGDVYIDGVKLEEPYVIKSPGIEQTFNIPEDSYFFLGDNRPISKDSRYWINPYINKKDIMGEAIFTVYPFNRIGKLQ